MSAVYSIYTSPNHAPIPNHLPTLIVTPHGNPSQILYSFIHASYNRECFLLTPSPQGDLCVAKMVPPPGSRGPGGPGSQSDSSHSSDPSRDKSVRCEASRNLKWSITNTGIHAPVYKLTLPNPDSPGNEQPLFQISKPNPNATFWTMFYFTYAGHLIPPKRIEFGKIQKNSAAGNGGGGGGTRVSITGKSSEEKAVWQTLGEGNEDMVEWIVLCAALNLLDEEIIKAAEKSVVAGGSSLGAAPRPVMKSPAVDSRAVPSSRPGRPDGGSGSSNGHHSPMQIRPTQGPPPQPFQRPIPVRAGQPPSNQGSGYSRPPPAQTQQAAYQQSRPSPQQVHQQLQQQLQQQQQQQQQLQQQQLQQQQGQRQGYIQSQSPYAGRPAPVAMPVPQSRPPPPQQYQQQQQQRPQQYHQQFSQPPPPQMPRPQASANGIGQRGYYGPPAGAQRGPPPAVGRQF